MSLIIAGILLMASIIKRNSKVLFFLLLFLMWLLMWGNTTSSDRISYIIMYNQIKGVTSSLPVEMGYQKMMLFMKALGVQFQVFLAFFSGIAYILITKTVFRYSKNPALVLTFYFLFPFLLDAEQVRSFLGMSLVLYAIKYLEKIDKKNICLYCLFCLLATTLQYSCVIFLVFLFVKFGKRTLVIVVSIMTSIFILLKRGYVIFNSILPKFVYVKLVSYLSGNITIKNIISVVFFLLIFGITIYLILKKKHGEINSASFYDVILKINIISIAFMPLVLYSDDFTRIPRAILILDYIVISNCIKKKITKKYELCLLLICLLIVGSRMAVYFVGGGYNSFIIPFFYEGSNSLPVFWDY